MSGTKCFAIVASVAVVSLGSTASHAQQPPPQSPNMTFFVTSNGSGKGADLGGLEGADRVHGEFVITLRLASGTDRGNGTARRNDQGRHGRAAVLRIFLLECCHRATGERDSRCNKF